MRTLLLVFFALLLVPFAGCGDKADTPTKGGGDQGDAGTAKPGETPAEVPAPKDEPKDEPAAAKDGAESPEALIEYLKQLQDNDDLSIMVPMVLPEHRGLLSFMFGMMMPQMAISMGEAMSGMAGAGDPAKAEEAKAKIQKLKDGFASLLEKHGVEMPEEDANPMAQMQGMQSDPEAAMAAFTKMFEGVDHRAFIRDSMAFMKSQDEGDGGMKMGPSAEDFAFDEVKIDESGDKAVATVKGKDDPLHMLKRDGRWYIDFAAMMPGR